MSQFVVLNYLLKYLSILFVKTEVLSFSILILGKRNMTHHYETEHHLRDILQFKYILVYLVSYHFVLK